MKLELLVSTEYVYVLEMNFTLSQSYAFYTYLHLYIACIDIFPYLHMLLNI